MVGENGTVTETRLALRRTITALHQNMWTWIESGKLQCLTREDGQGLTEYALILALIAVIAIAALTLLGGKVTDALSTVGTTRETHYADNPDRAPKRSSGASGSTSAA